MSSEKVTIVDIAKKAGVSIATVSRVINRQGNVHPTSANAVLSAMKELGYSKKESSSKPPASTPLILVVLPDIINPFYSQIIEGIGSACSNHNYRYMLYIASEAEAKNKRFLDDIKDSGAHGVIILSPITDVDILHEIEKICPLVQCAEFTEKANMPYVSIDDYLASRSLVEHMISKNYKKIALINGPREFKYSRKRLSGYKDALTKAGIPINEHHIYHISDIRFDAALPVISQLLSSPSRPDALFCVSDVLAAAAVKAAKQQNLDIPKDLAIAGFDDTYIATMCTPSITCVSQPRYSLGITACELLLERISNPYAFFRHVLLPTELILRDSL